MTNQFKIWAGGALVTSLLFFACGSPKGGNSTSTSTTNEVNRVATPSFNADSAYAYVDRQVAFGPRVPNTPEHKACAEYLASEMKRFGADVIVQEAEVKAFDNTVLEAKNIIAQFNPEMNNRLLLFAHWDSRPFADHDKDVSKRDLPIDGANDGASGVGVLMEIARQIGKKGHHLGIDIIFFDAEDYGQPDHRDLAHKEDTWCLGSQYWGKFPHKEDYYARYGILLDMVGAKDAFFYQEGFSLQYAPDLVKQIWNTAADLGYGNHFVFDKGGYITDDHIYVNKYRRIPCVDIIQFNPSSNSSFGDYWHTHNDDMSNVDKNTLKAVGQTVLEVIYREK
ncbi:M28 family peptidase [Carboxylicivirga linearis]|uniref:M28 family peptidase n=1 Tax=Carboxylicivirga linearis TaxID=1628157 RepID=A0ABS5K111_9BACT|nr:M28 family peptidase [Carboxylicivirga linearis]MBS2100813.1 M28 family peptidase [Carboxylicivirga linearis]